MKTLLLPLFLVVSLSAQTFLSLDPSAWALQYGSPRLTLGSNNGLSFQWVDNSDGADGAHYLTTPFTIPMTGYLSMTVQNITLSGTPTYLDSDPTNTCVYPAHVRLYFQRAGQIFGTAEKYEFYRWWAVDPGSYQLDSQTQAVITVPLIPSAWSSVLGKRGDYDKKSTKAFYDAIANVGAVGMTFGRGCFYGHGVFVPSESGAAEFHVLNYTVQ